MSTLTYLAAIGAAQREAMAEDERVVLLGEDVRSNLFGTAPGFVELFGADRVINTPISEASFAGIGVGAAMTGLRPIVDFTYATFMYLAMDQLINQAAKNRYMFGAQASIPIVYRAGMFYGASTAAHHSDRPYPMFMNVPGLKIVAPAGAHDAKGLLRTAIRTDDPVLVFEDATLWTRREELPEEEFFVPLGEARMVREGGDVTVVAIAGAVHHARAAAESLAGEGISVEVIDPRSLVPLDRGAILRSVAKTGRLVVVDPACRTCSAASEIAAIVAEEGFESLRAPIRRVTTPDVPIPFSPPLEKPLYPDRLKIEAAVRTALGAGSPSVT
ncbi:MAG: alpha-ketoacid dehydrogenase subunit beta [Candidatus Dormibacteraceae bacterium]